MLKTFSVSETRLLQQNQNPRFLSYYSFKIKHASLKQEIQAKASWSMDESKRFFLSIELEDVTKLSYKHVLCKFTSLKIRRQTDREFSKPQESITPQMSRKTEAADLMNDSCKSPPFLWTTLQPIKVEFSLQISIEEEEQIPALFSYSQKPFSESDYPLKPKPQPLSSAAAAAAAEEHLKVEASWKIHNFRNEPYNFENIWYFEKHLVDKETFYPTNIYFRNFPIVFKFPELQEEGSFDAEISISKNRKNAWNMRFYLLDKNQYPKYTMLCSICSVVISYTDITECCCDNDCDEYDRICEPQESVETKQWLDKPTKPANLKETFIELPLFNDGHCSTYLHEDNLNIEVEFHITISRPKLDNHNKRSADFLSHSHSHPLPLSRSQDSGTQGLLKDIEKMYKNPRLSDIKLKVTLGKEQIFYCHKSILGARSSILLKMIENFIHESEESVLEIDDITAEAMTHFLSFIYREKFENKSWIQNLPQLAYAADKYGVESLSEFCNFNLCRILTSKNAVAVADLAGRLNLTQAVSDTRKFIAENVETITLNFEEAAVELGFRRETCTWNPSF